jgi:hypothetical protein
MIRFLILAFVAYVFYRALKKWMIGEGGTGTGQPETTGSAVDDVLIQDPLCQTYFARRDGVHLRHEGRDLYFCSNQCRDRYLQGGSPPDDQAGSA